VPGELSDATRGQWRGETASGSGRDSRKREILRWFLTAGGISAGRECSKARCNQDFIMVHRTMAAQVAAAIA
jgi:hypothetical protein